MKVYAFNYSSGFICLLALFIIFEIVNYSEGVPTETLFPTLREKRARPPLSKKENKRVVKKQGTGIVGTLKGAKESLDNKSISGTKAIGVALLGVGLGAVAGTVAGRGIEKDQQGFMQQQYNGGGFVPNYR
uniref:Glycine zipper 2TM domain-containing protein n=1 Tax=Meloidogyne javanica TaxID=6303 RepID=A0A915MW11_MELJA